MEQDRREIKDIRRKRGETWRAKENKVNKAKWGLDCWD